MVETRFYLVKDCEVLIVNSLIKELKVGLEYTQAIPVGEGFLNLPIKLHWCMPIDGSHF